jgi:tetratricopeptide (TPR) repeat protein
MSARVKVWIAVAIAALATAGTAVGVTLATRTDVKHEQRKPPPFAADPTAPPEVARAVREALAAWPAGTVRRLRILGERYPASGLVRLELGLALALTGQQSDANTAWKNAERVQPDSPSAVRAQDLRHPGTAPGLPPFVPSFARPTTAAERHLVRGVLFQQALRPVSALREFEGAVRAAPNDPEALTAAAVGRYDKDRPALAFSQLGPLVRRFPNAQTVRFHLGLALIYFGDFREARKQLERAEAEGPRTRLGKQAHTLIKAGRKR